MKNWPLMCVIILIAICALLVMMPSCSRGTGPVAEDPTDSTLVTSSEGIVNIHILRSGDMQNDTLFTWRAETLYVVLPLDAEYVPQIYESIIDDIIWSDHNAVEYNVTASGVLHVTVYVDIGDIPLVIHVDTIYTNYSNVDYDVVGSTVYFHVYVDTTGEEPPPDDEVYNIRVYFCGDYASQVPEPYSDGPRLGTTLTSNHAWIDGIVMLRDFQDNVWYRDCLSISPSETVYLINFKLSDYSWGYWAVTMTEFIGAVRVANLDTGSEVTLTRPIPNGIGQGANVGVILYANGTLTEP